MPISVIVVDDHRMFADALAGSLANEPDITVAGTAATAEQGLRRVEESHPAVVLVDHGLPDEDGVSLSSRIRERFPDTQVVLLTARLNEDLLVRAIESGCCGYVSKEQGIDDAVSAVKAAARGETTITPSVLARVLPRLTNHRDGPSLTAREVELLRLLADGKGTDSIASEWSVSAHTVRTHVRNLLQKLGAHSKLEAVAIAARRGLIDR